MSLRDALPLAWRSLLADVRYAVPAKLWLRANDRIRWSDVYDGWSRPDVGRSWAPLAYDEVRVVGDNGSSFELRHELVATARTIDIATYYIAPDDTGRAMVGALVSAARRGARVRLLVDAHMTKKRAFENRAMGPLLQTLREGGVDLRLFRNRARPYEHSHWKVFVADGRYALTGGRNFADHYRLAGWRDVDLFFAGEAARDLGRLFDAVWAGRPLAGSGPFFAYESRELSGAPFWRFLFRTIRGAERTLDVEHAYVVPHAPLLAELAAAVRRGVRVRLLTNSSASNDLVHARVAQAKAAALLARAGVAVHLRPGSGRTLHAKYLVADGRAVLFGSMNLDYFSPRLCAELTLHAYDERLARALGVFFEEGLRDAVPFSEDDAPSRFDRALGTVAERFFHEFI